jgi:hypothetical protein
MKTTMHLPDCFDRNLLQTLQNAFAKLIGTTVAVVDPWGVPITIPSGLPAPRENACFANAEGREMLSPAVVMVYSNDACLGQWLVGGAAPKPFPADALSHIFIPMQIEERVVGFLGFDRQTVRDWPPQAMARFRDLGMALAEHLDRQNAAGKDGDIPSRFNPAYGNSAPQQSISA